MNLTPKVYPFKFWCQKVLPLVYDDSLSYYEVLCKLVDKINNLVETTNNDSDAITELQQELIALKEYVDNIEEHINIEQYVSDKLEEMFENGQLDDIMETVMEGYKRSSSSLVKQLTPLDKYDVLFHDNFHRANSSSAIGTNGDETYPMTYTTSGATLGIKNNSAYIADTSSDERGIAVADMGTPDVFLECSVGNLENEPETYRGAGVIARYVDGDNYIMAVLRQQYVRVYEIVDNVSTEVINRYITNYSKVSKFGIDVSGSKLKLFINGVFIGSADIELEGTKAGIVIEAQSVARVTNFCCKTKGEWIKRVDMLKDGTIPFDVTVENGNNLYNFQFVTDPDGSGDTVMRFENRKADNTVRSEIRFLTYPYPINEMWFSFDMMLGSEFEYVQETISDILMQLHDNPREGESGGMPCFNLQALDGKWRIGVNYSDFSYDDIQSYGQFIDSYLPDIGKWVNWQIHIKNAYSEFLEPIAEVYKNGVLVFSSTLPNTYNNPRAPYLKMGMYNWGWRDFPDVPQASKRVLYIKNVNIIE